MDANQSWRLIESWWCGAIIAYFNSTAHHTRECIPFLESSATCHLRSPRCETDHTAWVAIKQSSIIFPSVNQPATPSGWVVGWPTLLWRHRYESKCRPVCLHWPEEFSARFKYIFRQMATVEDCLHAGGLTEYLRVFKNRQLTHQRLMAEIACLMRSDILKFYSTRTLTPL